MPFLAVIRISLDDVDGFIQRHGPAEAEAVAVTIAARLATLAGEGSDVIREGYGRFAMVRSGVGSEGAVHHLGEYLRSAASDPVTVDRTVYSVNASVWVAAIPIRDVNPARDGSVVR